MKEPTAVDGIVEWNHVRISDTFQAELKAWGYKWNEQEERYELGYDALKELNKAHTTVLDPISFQPDEFHRAVHRGYGGDCM
jgi:hypothetical protein